MPKGLKLILIAIVPLALGVGYGLAKAKIIPTQQMGSKNPALAKFLKMAGLYKTPPVVKPGPKEPVKSGPTPEQQAMKAQRDALDKERADWDAQKLAQTKTAETAKLATVAALPDPHEIGRLASIYEQMSAENSVKIFAKLPDPQVVALMRRMDEKRVSEILAAIPPERAAFFTQQLAHTPPPTRTAALTP